MHDATNTAGDTPDRLPLSSPTGRLIVGVNYHPHDSGPETWSRDIRMMQDAGLEIVRLGHLAWDTFEPADGTFSFAWFDEVMDLMHAAGIGVILDIAVRPAPLWLHKKHPTIDITDTNGNRLYANSRYMDDAGDPHFLAHATRLAEAVTKRYAGHPALIAFGIDNEPGDGPISYSETVRARFITWLEAKYGTPADLNHAWAGHRWSRQISSFDEVGLPLPGDTNGAPERTLDFRRFVSDEINRYLLATLHSVQKNAPDALITSNMWYYTSHKSFDYAEIAYTGKMTRAGNGFYPSRSIIDTDRLRHSLFGIARIQLENTAPYWCVEFTTMTASPGSIRKSAYASLMLGNQLVCGWTWQTMHAGEEQFLQGMIDWDGRPNRKLDEYRQIANEFHKIEKHGFPYRPQAEIAIALDFASQIASARFPEPHDRQARTAFDMLLDRNLDTRIVDIGRSDLNYKILLIPGMLIMEDDHAAKIREFVERGGTVIMTSSSASLDTTGQVFTTTRPGHLDDVFGIRIGSYEETALMNESARRQSGIEELDLVIHDRRVTTTTPRFDIVEPRAADVIGRITGLGAERPVATVNEFGAGRAIYVAVSARREVLDAVLEPELERLSVRRGPLVPAGVMARDIDARHTLYLNLDGARKSIEVTGGATSILRDRHYQGGFVLEPFDAEFIQLD